MCENKICPKCGNEHSKSGKFCSRSCANSRTFSDETNAKRSASNSAYRLGLNITKTRKCIKCNERFPIIKREKICKTCKPDVVKPVPDRRTPLQRTIDLVTTGEVRTHSEASIRRHMRKFLLHRDGHRCKICGTSDWFGNPIPLVCDHIDGDSTNSDINNFRMICCNCDALLDTYKSKNIGKGRKYDREYRQQH